MRWTEKRESKWVVARQWWDRPSGYHAMHIANMPRPMLVVDGELCYALQPFIFVNLILVFDYSCAWVLFAVCLGVYLVVTMTVTDEMSVFCHSLCFLCTNSSDSQHLWAIIMIMIKWLELRNGWVYAVGLVSTGDFHGWSQRHISISISLRRVPELTHPKATIEDYRVPWPDGCDNDAMNEFSLMIVVRRCVSLFQIEDPGVLNESSASRTPSSYSA